MTSGRGFVMIAVLVTLVLVAAVALLLATQGTGEADRAGRGTEALQAEYVAQAAIEHALWEADRNACAAYDLPATPFGAHSYSASFSPANGSPTTVTATATLASGLTRSASRAASVVYHPAPSQTVLQPNAAQGRDAWFSAAKPTWNYGAASALNAADAASNERSLIAFDLTRIPPGARVVSATLELWASRVSSAGNVRLFRVTTDWVEGTCQGSSCIANGATWATTNGATPWQQPGGDYDSSPVASQNVDIVGTWHGWDITDTVAGWVAGETPNYGLLIRAAANVEFTSSDGADAARRPKLTIGYRCECGVACAAPQGSGRVLLVVGDNPTPTDDRREALFESWGYTVERIDDGCSGLLCDVLDPWDVDWNDHDVVYVSDSVSDEDLANRLTNAPIGVVTEKGRQGDNLGFSSTHSWITADTLTIDDNGHDITQPFAVGPLRIYDARMEGVMVGGSVAPGLKALGHWWAGTPSLAVLEVGSAESGGGTASARRVLLPFGRNLNWQYVNNNGRLIVQRSLAWAAGSSSDAAGLVARWKLDEVSGTTASDSAGGHHGTLNGGTWAAGQLDGALQLNGSSQFVQVADAAALNLVDAFTLMAWVRPQNLGGYRLAVSKGATPGSALNYWLGTNNAAISFGFFSDSSHEFMAPVGLEAGQWYHIAATFNNPTDQWEIYLDGAKVAGDVTAQQPPVVAGPVYLGRSTYGTYWNGALDDVRIYDRVLAAAEIAVLAQPPGSGPPPACNSKFADDLETGDYGGNNGDLTWTGAWSEVNESDGRSSGDEIVTTRGGVNRVLRVRDNDGGGEGVYRRANLSGFVGATLLFKAWRDSLDNGNDYALVQISTDGGSNWTEIDRLQGPGTDSSGNPQYAIHDISSFIAADTRLRFLTSAQMGSDDSVYFDDVEICVE